MHACMHRTQINGPRVTAGLAWHYVKYAPDDATGGC